MVHDELQRIARRCLKGERVRHGFQATSLVNEAYLRLVDVRQVDWQNRTHFLAMAARVMRRVLVDLARARGAQKRGHDAINVTLAESILAFEKAQDVVALDDALMTLAKIDARKGRVVELRFFGGLTVEEAAEALGVSPKTVLRDWKVAKAWLRAQLSEPSA